MKQPVRAAGLGLTFAFLTTLGCSSGPPSSLLSTRADLAEDLKPFTPDARVARMQRGEGVPLPPGVSAPPGVSPAVLPSGRDTPATARAYVNGKPIFDYEIMNQIPSTVRRMGIATAGAGLKGSPAKVYEQAREDLVDQEVVYQEAVRRLEKSNPKILLKLKEIAEQETDKQVENILRRDKPTPEQLKEMLPGLKRHMERGLVFSEYLRSKTITYAKAVIGFQEIRDYYEAHKNEYLRPEGVEWQDIFLAIGPKYPTLADARRAAEDLIARVRTTEDFARLVPYDDGDSKLRGGMGYGKRRGEIKPAELEEYLFKMRENEIGPVIELSTGVHIFRLIRRDRGGLAPLDEKLQRQISDKLLEQVIRREEERIIRELRGRADIVYEGG